MWKVHNTRRWYTYRGHICICWKKIRILCDVTVCHWATFLRIVMSSSSSGASFPRKIFWNIGTTHPVTRCHIAEDFIFITTARTSNLARFEWIHMCHASTHRAVEIFPWVICLLCVVSFRNLGYWLQEFMGLYLHIGMPNMIEHTKNLKVCLVSLLNRRVFLIAPQNH